jgi:hypothetical protein
MGALSLSTALRRPDLESDVRNLGLGYVVPTCVIAGVLTSIAALCLGRGKIRVAAGAIGLMHFLMLWEWLGPTITQIVF